MRSCKCAVVAFILFFFHSTAQAQEKLSWQYIANSHWTLEVKEPEVTITVMEFGSGTVVIWKWPCKNSDRTHNIMQRSDGQLRQSGKCLTETYSVTYETLLRALKAVARESSPSTELLNVLTQFPSWSDIE